MAGKRHTIGKTRGVKVVWMVLACLLCTLWGGVIGGLIGSRVSWGIRTENVTCPAVYAKHITATETITLLDEHGQTAAMLWVDGDGLATLSLHDTRDDEAVMYLDTESIWFWQSETSSQWWPKKGSSR